MRIQHNIAAMNSYTNYSNNVKAVNKNLEKLSSGYKINRAGDDAAGLAISEKMRAQITGLEAAQKNVKDGISLVKTAEGAMQEVQDMLKRMKYLATQSANGTYDNEVDRDNLNKEVEALKTEIDRIADSANFNGIKLLDGSLDGGGRITANGTVYTGANVSKFSAGEMATGIKVSGGADFSDTISTGAYSTEVYILDGQKLEIDMSKGNGATIADLLKKDFTGDLTTEAIKKLASDLTDAFNAEIKEQGLKGEVKFSVSSDGKSIVAQSANQNAESEFGFAGVTIDEGKSGDDDKAVSSVGAHLFADTAGKPVSGATSIKAQQDYNGAYVSNGEVFNMDINGVKVAVTVGADIKPMLGNTPATTMDAAAGTLQTAVQTAIAQYNEERGLTAGKYDKVSGLTGLVATDFTVEADKSGGFKVTYKGDENITFSFNDVGNRDVAQRLGLANGSSTRGGAGGLTLQIGDTAESFNQMTVNISDMHVRSLGIKNIDISNQNGAAEAIDVIKDAINKVSATRGDLGAIQNRLDHTYNNLSTMRENIQDAESTIRDTDIAEEMMSYTKNNILVQSAQAMLAQANQIPQGVLQLLG